MSREPWNGQPVKKGNWGTWAQIETPPAVNQSCYTCIHSDENACMLLNTVISEIGKGYYKQCKHYVFDDFNDIGISRKRKKQMENSIDRSDYILPEDRPGRPRPDRAGGLSPFDGLIIPNRSLFVYWQSVQIGVYYIMQCDRSLFNG